MDVNRQIHILPRTQASENDLSKVKNLWNSDFLAIEHIEVYFDTTTHDHDAKCETTVEHSAIIEQQFGSGQDCDVEAIFGAKLDCDWNQPQLGKDCDDQVFVVWQKNALLCVIFEIFWLSHWPRSSTCCNWALLSVICWFMHDLLLLWNSIA